MTAYYNEIDPYAAQWLRNLISAGHIAPGVVDERSIEDIEPAELDGYTQCHFFAGIGVWSLALRKAGWPDNRPVWTGSCPCQPFSSAGKGAGFDDERHLWPAFHHLIEQCRPATVIGEQVASKDSEPWIDLVQADLEALDYAFGAVPFPSASVGAPHIRDRLYWVGHANNEGLEGHKRGYQAQGRWDVAERSVGSASEFGGLADTLRGNGYQRLELESNGWSNNTKQDGLGGEFGRLANADRNGCKTRDGIRLHGEEHDIEHGSGSCAQRPGPTNGFWGTADWLLCRDGKWRPVEPGTFPLAHGAASKVGRLRAYGNAINAQAAQVFIECVM
jgi:DNA (cytosine-5)-methyltransferase 1